MLCRVELVRTDVSEVLITSIIRMTIIGKLGILAVTSKRSTLLRNPRATGCHIPEDGIFHSHRRENTNLTQV
jgi:hypothetical protein